MTPAKFIQKRSGDWRALEKELNKLEYSMDVFVEADRFNRFARLYRAVCTDYSLAQAYRLPEETREFLENLVARGHSVLYSFPRNRLRDFWHFISYTVPVSIFKDKYVWVCQLTFFGFFFLTAFMAYNSQAFAETIVDPAVLERYVEMHAEREPGESELFFTGSAFYIWNNVSIDLTTFCLGILGGVGSLLLIIFNSVSLGTIIGYLLNSPASVNIWCWIQAHGPFELYAIGLSGGAGFRIGFALIAANGRERLRAMRDEAEASIPTIALACVFTFLAAFIESGIGPLNCAVPVVNLVKKGLMFGCSLFIFAYIYVMGGFYTWQDYQLQRRSR